MHTFRENVFVTTRAELPGVWLPVVFYELADGKRYVHHGARATPKVA
jgi:hypothetical protein